MKYSISDSVLQIEGRPIDAGGPVKKILEWKDRVIAFYYQPERPLDDALSGRNIVCFDRDGKEVWRIAAIPQGESKNYPYPNVWRDSKDGKFKVYDAIGFTCELDPETGELSNCEFTK